MLANMFPGNYYSGDESKALDFMGYFAHQKQQDEAFKNQELNRQVALEDMLYNQQKRPLELTKMGLDNQGLEALLPGKRADSSMKELNLRGEQETINAKIKAALAKEAANLSEDEFKQTKTSIYQQLANPFISDETRRVLETVRDNLPENHKLAQMLGSKEKVAQVAANAGVKKAEITASRPPAARGGSTAPPKPFKDDLVTAQYWQQQADQAKDPAEKAQFAALAEAARQRHLALIQAREQAKKAGSVDLGATGVAVVPPITAPTQTAPKPAAAAGGAIRMKDGKGKIYNIPASRKQEALADGLTLSE